MVRMALLAMVYTTYAEKLMVMILVMCARVINIVILHVLHIH